jgi:cyclic lactone autoinducer peptide
VNIANVMVMSSVAMNAGRQAGASPSNALSTYQPVEPERSEAIQLDVTV